MERTWEPTVGGTLAIIAGAITLTFCIVIVVFGRTIGEFFGFEVVWEWSTFAIPLIISATIAIVGGIFALKRKIWWLALVGAICALIGPTGILGVLAIIFIVLGKREFS